jgi:hypothetical protein
MLQSIVPLAITEVKVLKNKETQDKMGYNSDVQISL